jgi:Na+/H+ antiporter
MLHDNLLLIISLLFAVSLLIMLGQKLRISYPIFLVIAGLAISFIPGIPPINIEPEMVFLIFLPPLLYEAAWYTSWKDFWRWKRPIGMLAFGLVIFTSLIVAYVSQAMIPGFTLALGFLLGGIISPPDAVAANSVLKNLKVPKRILSILEGESLVNDASSLIVFRFALAAVVTGHFALQEAVTDFFLVAGMGIVVGLVVAHIMYLIHRFLPTNASIDTSLTLMTPYVMYLAAEHFHFSGVMAVVSGGLFLSYRSHEIMNHKSRMQSTGVWATLAFMLNGLVFILIGLELPLIVNGLNGYSLPEAIGYGLIISAVAIVIRLVWVYPITFIPRWFSKKIREREKSPGWKGPLIVSWAGMRGVVSLASALSVPLILDNGAAFPQRNLILFITFIVILVTLVFQGLTLPLLIKWTKIKEIDDVIPEEEQETAIQLRLMRAAQKRLTEKYAAEIETNDLIANLKKQLDTDISLTWQKLKCLECFDEERGDVKFHNEVLLELIDVQRKELFLLRKEKDYDDEIIREQQSQLDLDEAKISHHRS